MNNQPHTHLITETPHVFKEDEIEEEEDRCKLERGKKKQEDKK